MVMYAIFGIYSKTVPYDADGHPHLYESKEAADAACAKLNARAKKVGEGPLFQVVKWDYSGDC